MLSIYDGFIWFQIITVKIKSVYKFQIEILGEWISIKFEVERQRHDVRFSTPRILCMQEYFVCQLNQVVLKRSGERLCLLVKIYDYLLLGYS